VTDAQTILPGAVKIELMNLVENYLLFPKTLINNSKIYFNFNLLPKMLTVTEGQDMSSFDC